MLMKIVNWTLIAWEPEALEEIKKHKLNSVIDVTIKTATDLTDQQRKAVYVYCSKLAREFKRAGITRTIDLPGGTRIETDWSKEAVKSDIWAELQVAQFGTRSVNDLERKQVSELYEIINRDVCAPMGVYVPFPKWQDLAT